MLTKAVGRIDDWLNPILVKELRQAVRGKFIVGIFHLFMAVQFLVVALFLVNQADRITSGSMRWHAGRELFMSLFVVLEITCLMLIPLYAFARMTMERSGENLDLVSISTLKPWRTICGKIQGGLGLCMVIHAACLPFIFLTYMFRGVDLPTVMVLIGMEVVVFVVALLAVIFLASIPCSRVFQVLMGLGLVVVLGIVVGTTSGAAWGLMQSGVGSLLGSWDFWQNALAFVLLMAAVAGLFYALAVGLISPPAANRSLPIRIYFTIAWVLTAVGAMLTADRDSIYAWHVFWSLVLCLAFMVASSERVEPSGRIRAQIPRHRLFRPLAMLFYSGAAGGLIWALLLAAFTPLLAALGLDIVGASFDYDEVFWGYAIAMVYTFAFTMIAVLLQGMLSKWVKHQYTWVLVIIVAGGLLLAPMFVGFMVTSARYEFLFKGSLWMIGSPILISMNKEFIGPCLGFSSIMAIVGMFVNWRWFSRQVVAFQPMDPK